MVEIFLVVRFGAFGLLNCPLFSIIFAGKRAFRTQIDASGLFGNFDRSLTLLLAVRLLGSN